MVLKGFVVHCSGVYDYVMDSIHGVLSDRLNLLQKCPKRTAKWTIVMVLKENWFVMEFYFYVSILFQIFFSKDAN